MASPNFLNSPIFFKKSNFRFINYGQFFFQSAPGPPRPSLPPPNKKRKKKKNKVEVSLNMVCGMLCLVLCGVRRAWYKRDEGWECLFCVCLSFFMRTHNNSKYVLKCFSCFSLLVEAHNLIWWLPGCFKSFQNFVNFLNF